MTDADELESMTLRYLRRIDENLDCVREDIDGIQSCLGRLETEVERLRAAVVQIYSDPSHHQ